MTYRELAKAIINMNPEFLDSEVMIFDRTTKELHKQDYMSSNFTRDELPEGYPYLHIRSGE